MEEQPVTCPPHHMVIEPPHGVPWVGGRCKKCGLEKSYKVWPDELDKLRVTVVDRMS